MAGQAASGSAVRVTCRCCGKSVHPKTEKRHLEGKAKPHVRASFAYRQSHSLICIPPARRGVTRAPKQPQVAVASSSTLQAPPESPGSNSLPSILENSVVPMELEGSAIGVGLSAEDSESAVPCNSTSIAEAVQGVQTHAWTGRLRRTTVEDVPEEEDEGETQAAEEDEGRAWPDESAREGEEYDEEFWNEYIDEVMAFGPSSDMDGVSAQDHLSAEFEASNRLNFESLSDADKATLRIFALKTDDHLTRKTLKKLPFAFPGSSVPSTDRMRTRVTFLSGIKPVKYDCCINSCCCFVGPHAEHDTCPYCHEPRRNRQNRPRKQFMYIPIIPRLQAFYGNPEMATRMKHRACVHQHDPEKVTDVYDSMSYRSKLDQHVRLHDQTLRHKHFSDSRDVALGLSTDGFGPFRRRNKTCWPLLGFNYNLAPDIRFNKANWLPIGAIPGPKKPVDFDSYQWPMIEEMLKLAAGVRTFDILTRTIFLLHAYLILVFGDIPAMSMVMRVKGHNGKCPCRMCEIIGVRIPNKPRSPYYVPLDRSSHPDVRSSAGSSCASYDPSNLPRRTHNRFLEQALEVQMANTEAESERLAKEYGIKGIPLLSCLSSLTFPNSFPYDFMHLVWENVIKNLVALWTGEYKGLDCGKEDYVLDPEVWKEIGEATAKSGSTIPSAYGPRPPNIASDKMACTADTWSFWALYIGPVVLRGRFRHDRYYSHFIRLIKILHICLQFEITLAEIQEVREGLVNWVREYERIYYQSDPTRLSTCPVTIHALLHIADSILSSGPVWASWAFPMERFCGILKPAIRSRRFPFVALDNYLVDITRLNQIKVIYGAADALALRSRPNDSATTIPGYDSCVLLPPYRPAVVLEDSIRDKVLSCLATRYDVLGSTVRPILPTTVVQWAKVQILGGGDLIRSASLGGTREDTRNASFVRYECLVDRNAAYRNRPIILELSTFYGELQDIYVVDIPACPTLKLTHPEQLILAGIRTCTLDNRTAPGGLDIHYYSHTGRYEVVDIQNIQCLVGRVRDRGQWAIIDRSGSLARAMYIEEDDE